MAQKTTTNPFTNQKCMPGLHPVNDIVYDCPESEDKVYNALSDALPQGWYAWHSIKLRTVENEFAECDFVITDPNQGILILEVKGGAISKQEGLWYQNNKPLKTSPLDQAKRCCRILLSKFREKDIKPPRIGLAVCFPDIPFEQQPTQGDLEGLVVGSGHLPYFEEVLPDLLKKAIRSFMKRKPSPGWIKVLHNMWCESWVPEMRLSIRLKASEEKRLRLDQEQFLALCRIIDNDKVIVQGGPETGKTVLACELAKKEAANGRNVLLLSFTDALGLELSKKIKEPNITATPIGKFAVKLLRDKGHEIHEIYTPEFWDNIPLQAAVDGLSPEDDRWDTVIVDEGQDMGSNEWELIRECAKGDKRIWIFEDNNQDYWKDRNIPDDLLDKCVKYKLNTPYRCPPGVQALADAYVGGELDIELVRCAIENRTIKIIRSNQSNVHEDVGIEINDLLREGFELSDIAVISLWGRRLEENIMHLEKLGGQTIVKATGPDAYNNIVCDTFLRFKGLERPAVIVTDLRNVTRKYEIRMTMAVSRALSVLRIVGVESEVNKDILLSSI